MNSFSFHRALDVGGAVQSIQVPGAKFVGGGTNLIDLMKLGVERPVHLVDINSLPLAEIRELPGGGLSIGALARNSDTADHPLVRINYPLLAQALVSGASPQLRNMATLGGNLLQRTRCYYFNDLAYAECNKRTPGSGCAALQGFNRIHAILGASDACIAVHPSDLCVALVALDAVVNIVGPAGPRSIPLADFHRLPGSSPERDTNLAANELIVAVELPPSPFAQHSHYLKIRDRQSYAFALVSVAAVLETDGELVRNARIVLGGVASKPWRAKAAESLLIKQKPGRDAFEAAGNAAVEGAHGYGDNAFKVELARRAVIRALEKATGAA